MKRKLRWTSCPRCKKEIMTTAEVNNKLAGICSECSNRDDEFEVMEIQKQSIQQNYIQKR
ncbi:hypothetical protein [Thermoactinomyces sp. DSM 45892]|uniref:hypothetical protein n=1 Tax=Thermoactinomyces sp. DSM 45892 TaxID=1882753 RepID=UPI00089841C4|nr:hypothetical protein [Thermoactinomyces sp. DSM 45892]SDY88070.1 hypothetical protein SAMN05444416_109154 [Thermoactinomyces sp. DSM 45892]